MLRWVSYLECIADKRAEEVTKGNKADSQQAGKEVDKVVVSSPKEQTQVDLQQSSKIDYVPAEYTRTLDKAYGFFKDGHVQQIRYHPMPSVSGYISVAATVLPSMRKDRIYHVVIVITEHTAHAITTCCACPAGLSGCCNHVTATLYCLEDYIHCGLQEDEQKGCTDRLKVWNRPRKRNVEARPTDDVSLTKEQYGLQKRFKIHHVNKWDCRPLSRRIIDPNKVRRLKEQLSAIEESKIASINNTV